MHGEELEPGPHSRERRRVKRLVSQEPVQFEWKESAQTGGTVAFDIGSGGIRLNFYDFVPLNTQLTLRIHLSTESIVECLGRVVWIERLRHMERYQAGVQFLDIEENFLSRQAIDQFVNSLTATGKSKS